MSLPDQHGVQLAFIEACRACLDTKSTNYVQLSSEGGAWSELYQFCVDLSVSVDGGSQLLCSKCADLIKLYAEFKKQCHKSEEFWCSLLTDAMKCSVNKIDIKVENHEIHIVESNSLDIDGHTYHSGIDTHKNHDDIDSLKEESVEVLEESIFEGADSFMSDIDLSVIKKKKSKDIKKKLKCDTCQREYKNKRWLLSHLKTCENTSKTTVTKSEVLYCGLCEFTSDRELMKEHLDGHDISNEMKCGNCDFVGKDFASIVSHRYSHQPKDLKARIFCHVCDVTMRSSAVLQYHYRTVHLKKPGLDCTLCKKSFKTYKCWRDHDRWHRVDKFICDICGKKFLYRNAIEAHMIDHAEFNKFICETCGRGFKRLFNLKCHVSNRHIKHAPVKCSHCDRTFKSDFTLQNHLRFVNKEKPYSCPVCTKGFPSEVTLKNHLFWHSDERPFSCELCAAKYKAKSQLKIHMRQHTGIMPFKCQHCDKSFASSNQLKVHSSVHTGVRRHKCNYCHRTFHGRKLVEAHCAAQHKDKEIKLDVLI
ncbi:zinc finger protein 845-like [Cydia pomonella]|uniref:zinc finger protein 845-like n=1 Tax=Cydia pomonella TaxID=82600 RepID=UPI002ADDD7B0|nr:zinc finger protein 845-like [Cydia pomonella]